MCVWGGTGDPGDLEACVWPAGRAPSTWGEMGGVRLVAPAEVGFQTLGGPHPEMLPSGRGGWRPRAQTPGSKDPKSSL